MPSKTVASKGKRPAPSSLTQRPDRSESPATKGHTNDEDALRQKASRLELDRNSASVAPALRAQAQQQQQAVTEKQLKKQHETEVRALFSVLAPAQQKELLGQNSKSYAVMTQTNRPYGHHTMQPPTYLTSREHAVMAGLRANIAAASESERLKSDSSKLNKDLKKLIGDAAKEEKLRTEAEEAATTKVAARLARAVEKKWHKIGKVVSTQMSACFEVYQIRSAKGKQDEMLRDTEALTKKLIKGVLTERRKAQEAEAKEQEKRSLRKKTKRDHKVPKGGGVDDEDDDEEQRAERELNLFLNQNEDRDSVAFEQQLRLLNTLNGQRPLRDYQRSALRWLINLYNHNLNGILADEMGLGKTVQTIALFAYFAEYKQDWGPHLVVVPTTVVLNWEMEFKRWLPGFKVVTYIGSAKERKALRTGWTQDGAFNVVITSYGIITQDRVVFRRRPWGFLVLDEAHTIKNWASQKWQALFDFQAEYRLLLTGTPLQNSVMELWSLLHFLLPSVSAFESDEAFRQWFSDPLNEMVSGKASINEELVERMHALIRPFMLRRLKKDVESQLPGKVERVILCRLSKRQQGMYDGYKALQQTREMLRRGGYQGAMGVLLALRKVCDHPDLFMERPTASPFIMLNSHEVQLYVPRQVLMIDNEQDLLFRRACRVTTSGIRNLASATNNSIISLTTTHSSSTSNPFLRFAVDMGWDREQMDAKRRHNEQVRRRREQLGSSGGGGSSTERGGSGSKKQQSKKSPPLFDAFHILSTQLAVQLMPSENEEENDDAALLEKESTAIVRASEESDNAFLTANKSVFCSGGQQRQSFWSDLARASRVAQKAAAKERIQRAFYHIRRTAVQLSFALALMQAESFEDVEISSGVAALIRREFPSLVPTVAERLEAMQPIISKFCVVVPKARAKEGPFLVCLLPVSHFKPFRRPERKDLIGLLGIARPPKERVNYAERVFTAKHFAKELWPIHNRTCFNFPEKTLLIHDCGKLQVLAPLLKKLFSEGHRALIFTQFTVMLGILEKFLALLGVTYLRLDGTTKPEARQQLVERFNYDEKIGVMILSTRSGGIGINLVGADTVIFYDSDWNPSMDLQAQDRVHRIGQTRQVTIYRLISENTVEERILMKARERKKLNNVVIRGGGFHQGIDELAVQNAEANSTNLGSDDLQSGDVVSSLLHPGKTNIRRFFHDFDEDFDVGQGLEIGGAETAALDQNDLLNAVEDEEDRVARQAVENEIQLQNEENEIMVEHRRGGGGGGGEVGPSTMMAHGGSSVKDTNELRALKRRRNEIGSRACSTATDTLMLAAYAKLHRRSVQTWYKNMREKFANNNKGMDSFPSLTDCVD